MTQENIFNILLGMAIGDSIGISYKNYFQNDIFLEKKQFFLEKLESKGSCLYETDQYNYTDNIDIILFFISHFINEIYDVNEEKLSLVLNKWFDKYDPFNIDGSLRMKIFSNIINSENSSSFYMLRLVLPLIILKHNNFENINKDEIKKRIYFIARFSNKDKQFFKTFHLLFDMFFESEMTFSEIKTNHIEIIEEIYSIEELFNDHIYSTLKILMEELEKEENIIISIKNIISYNISPEIIIPLFISLRLLKNQNELLEFEYNNFLSNQNINKLSSTFNDIYNKISEAEKKFFLRKKEENYNEENREQTKSI
jgi:hypothetical protein